MQKLICTATLHFLMGKGKKLLWQVNRGWFHVWKGNESNSSDFTGWMLLMGRTLCSTEMRGKAFTNLVFFSVLALPSLLQSL